MQALNRREMLVTTGATAAGVALAQSALAWQPAGASAAPLTPSEMGWDDAAGKYVLPPLPYAPAALEPHIDAETMSLHHDKHHLAYVNGLNSALDGLKALREANDGKPLDANRLKALSRELAFHGSGHFLHVLFWNNMAPADKGGGAEPTGPLADALTASFGSFAKAWDQFAGAAKAVEASGWALLTYEPMSRRLVIMQSEKHQNLTAWGVTPLLALDVWEHAYYLKYRNNRAAYVDAFKYVVNWADVGARYQKVRQA